MTRWKTPGVEAHDNAAPDVEAFRQAKLRRPRSNSPEDFPENPQAVRRRDVGIGRLPSKRTRYPRPYGVDQHRPVCFPLIPARLPARQFLRSLGQEMESLHMIRNHIFNGT